MSDLLLYNAQIYLGSESLADIPDILGINSNKITLIESSSKLSSQDLNNIKSNYKKTVDINNKWVTPGLIDCHTHLIYAGSRTNEFAARLKGESYETITQSGGGINSTVKSTRDISLENLIKLSEARIKQVINSGVTTVEIKSGYGLNLESEKKILQTADYLSKNYPIDIQKTFLGAHLVPKDFSMSGENTEVNTGHSRAEEYINYLVTIVLPDLVKNKLVDAVDGFCEHIAFTAEELRPLYRKAKEYNLKIKGHTEQLSKIGGADLVCEFGGLSCDHLEYADLNIVKLLQQSDTTAVLLPGAYYYLKETQKPPVELLRKFNVPMAIATDFNPGTSPIISLTTIMNMACILYGLTPQEAWQGVTLNAAKALGLEKNIGSIELNKQADLVIWDFNHPYDLCYYMGYDWDKIIIKNGELVEGFL